MVTFQNCIDSSSISGIQSTDNFHSNMHSPSNFVITSLANDSISLTNSFLSSNCNEFLNNTNKIPQKIDENTIVIVKNEYNSSQLNIEGLTNSGENSDEDSYTFNKIENTQKFRSNSRDIKTQINSG